MIEESKKFISKFNLESLGFEESIPFTDSVGFGAFKKLRGEISDYISLLQIYIPQQYASSIKQCLNIHLIYGRRTGGGVSYRSYQKSNDPLDLEFNGEYCYDSQSNKFFHGDEEILPQEIVREVYEKHIKTTKKLVGFLLRLKVKIIRYWLKYLFDLFSNLFIFIHYLVSGDKYRYEPLFGTETINERVISSRLERSDVQEIYESKSKKIRFFEYEASQWSIVIYSIIHLLVYFAYRPKILVDLFGNNFLIIAYVITSLFVMEFVIPKICRLSAKFFAQLSYKFLSMNISV